MPHSTSDNTRRVSAHLFAGAPKIATEWKMPCGAQNYVIDGRHALPPSYLTEPHRTARNSVLWQSVVTFMLMLMHLVRISHRATPDRVSLILNSVGR